MIRVSEIPLSQMPGLKIILVCPESSSGNVLGISKAPTREDSLYTQTSVILVLAVPCPGSTENSNVSTCKYAGMPSVGLMTLQEDWEVIMHPDKLINKMRVEIFNPLLLLVTGYKTRAYCYYYVKRIFF
jgi:hypothetical protein